MTFDTMTVALISAGAVAGVLVLAIGCAFVWRVVVPTNLVHVVQSARTTTSYGAGATKNAYYKFPTFLPFFGVTRIELPVNNFALRLDSYDAYDKDRAPFELDVIGFFQISDTNKAAQRAASFMELESQLKSIMQGAARTILARHDINSIMVDRATFGEAFTHEVDENLTAWGVKTVKSLELMDIRDPKGSTIIHDIMAKKSSHISMESRSAVAANARLATVAEIEAAQAVDIRKADQEQAVGERKAEQAKQVGIAQEKAQQEVQAQAKVTMDRQMDVQQVKRVREAEIVKQAAIVKAEQDRQTFTIEAEAQRAVAVTSAEGEKDAALLTALGVRAAGEAVGAAEQAKLLAPVNAQIALAEKIGSTPGYTQYLVSIREVEARERIGVANAQALAQADIKVIANAGDASSGITAIPDLLSARGGTAIGAMIQGLANTAPEVAAKVGLVPAFDKYVADPPDESPTQAKTGKPNGRG